MKQLVEDFGEGSHACPSPRTLYSRLDPAADKLCSLEYASACNYKMTDQRLSKLTEIRGSLES